jgi:ribokinase
MTRVLVVGSINMDLVVQTRTFPRLGETLFGSGFATHAGGKGGNQAVAAARLGASVCMVGRVGSDQFGQELKARLKAERIDTRWVRETTDVPTGIASITVCNTDNAIIVVSGANAALSPADLDAAGDAFEQADVVLTQLEVPIETVERAAELAARRRAPFILNPAPAAPLPEKLLARCSVITPNEHELSIALGDPSTRWQDLLTRARGRIVITKGEDGAYFGDAAGTLRHQPSFPTQSIDTTGAGDTFNGALAAFWHLGMAEAVRRGCAAGALKVSKAGAQEGMPTLVELEAYLTKQR